MHHRPPHFRVISLITLLILSALNTCAYATPRTWGQLQPGPYAVGFTTIERYDHSRAFAAKRDYFGNTIPGERARPMQVCIWYPAVPADDAVSVVYGEYAFAYPEDNNFMELLSQLHGRELQRDVTLMSTYGGMADM